MMVIPLLSYNHKALSCGGNTASILFITIRLCLTNGQHTLVIL